MLQNQTKILILVQSVDQWFDAGGGGGTKGMCSIIMNWYGIDDVDCGKGPIIYYKGKFE